MYKHIILYTICFYYEGTYVCMFFKISILYYMREKKYSLLIFRWTYSIKS